jgi:hypothetical protein
MKPLLVVLALLAGCASTGIVPADKGTYIVAKRSAQLGAGPPVGATAEVYQEAGQFCASQSKALETVKLEPTDSGFGRPAAASLRFRCVER